MQSEDLNKEQPVIELSELEKGFIQQGLEDIEKEEVFSHEEAMAFINSKSKE